ncbi:MAG: zinc dependent phospholipase C family protein [Desulfuromonadaceae bacterium]|nr:zinc dependent phospholipase C family protein [Desulfuromonadaceae bacterium]
MPLRTLILLAVVLLGWPEQALAWGFGVHLTLGNGLLANCHQLPETLATLLTAWPDDFLYGCISADITLGKKYTHYLKHCHSWNIGRAVLSAAETPAQQACAYGYLAHLAADTVAHGFMVPYKMVRSYNTLLLNHAYWELRFEAQIPTELWQQARMLAQQDFRDNDRMLRGVLANTLFSFGTNKQLFNSLLLLSRIRRWQRLLATLDRRSSWALEQEDREEYLQLAAAAGLSVLGSPESPYFKADPTGDRALATAAQLRTNLTLLWQDGKLSPEAASSLLPEIKQLFRDSILAPEKLLPWSS